MANQGPTRVMGWRRTALTALGVASVFLADGFAGAPARAGGPPPPPPADTSSDEAAPPAPGAGRTFISEIVDSTYFVGPAEFFALDLPVAVGGSRAIHLFGDVQVQGKGRDVIVRVFRSPDYQDWLKRRSGKEGNPIWTSPRNRAIHIDQPLPPGVPSVLLLDNGYSLRTPKRVRVQIQIQYEEGGAAAAAAQTPAAPPAEGDIVPRSNAADEAPPPPPPPPAASDSSN
ncbi:MAG TPA: hypothetical protein VF363_04395 [Candidatus Eisenbacteria bacterium]